MDLFEQFGQYIPIHLEPFGTVLNDTTDPENNDVNHSIIDLRKDLPYLPI
jgi:hypothetical protein